MCWVEAVEVAARRSATASAAARSDFDLAGQLWIVNCRGFEIQLIAVGEAVAQIRFVASCSAVPTEALVAVIG